MIAFFLGSHPEVSLAELRLVFSQKEQFVVGELAFFDLPEEVAAAKFSLLGGSPRFGTVVKEIELAPDADLEQVIADNIAEALKTSGKKEYVISLFGVKTDKRVIHHLVKQIFPAKYDGNFGERQHSPAAVQHVLLRGGVEFALVTSRGKLVIIEVKQTQDPKYWSLVDAERPGRDMRIGILPAKLARIMVNMTAVTKEGRLWDPFVGQATVLMQAASLGIKSYGTDKSFESVSKGKRNINWLVEKGLSVPGLAAIKVAPLEDAETNGPVTAMATEPFLGKPHFKPYSGEYLAKKEWHATDQLFDALLRIAQRTLRSGQRIVLVKPLYAYIAGKQVQWYNPSLQIRSDVWRVPEIIKDLGHLVWVQRDSVVGRELLVLEKR